MKVSYENTEAVRLLVESMVSTYKPDNPLTADEKAMYDREIGKIMNGG